MRTGGTITLFGGLVLLVSSARLSLQQACRRIRTGWNAGKWENRDISLIEGCWSPASDQRVRNGSSGRMVEVEILEMCLDAGGNGDPWMVMTDGASCSGDVFASFMANGKLRTILHARKGTIYCRKSSNANRSRTARRRASTASPIREPAKFSVATRVSR